MFFLKKHIYNFNKNSIYILHFKKHIYDLNKNSIYILYLKNILYILKLKILMKKIYILI